MNLHGLVAGVVAAVNPLIPLKVEINLGNVTSSDGRRVPSYACPVYVLGQVQALSAGDLQQLEGLNIQGQQRAIYLNQNVDGLVRVENKGGDLITDPAGHVWLITLVLEYWPDWSKVAVTLQNQVTSPLGQS